MYLPYLDTSTFLSPLLPRLMCRWPVRTVSVSFDGEFVASGSEDHFIDISHIESGMSFFEEAWGYVVGEKIFQIPVNAATNSLAWHPTRHLIAYACDDVDKSGRAMGGLRVWGYTT